MRDLAEMQVLHLTLSGGEPLAHPDFLQIGSSAKELGFLVRIKSNGHALRGEIVRRIAHEVDPYIIEISLHGARAETHDKQTRVPGSFDRLLANLDALRTESDLRIQLNATLTRWNQEEATAMYEIAENLECQLRFDTTVTPRDNGDLSPLSIAPRREDIEELKRIGRSRGRKLQTTSRDGTAAPEAAEIEDSGGPVKNCGTGSTTLTVNPFGDVFPCIQWRRSLGNLHDHSIREIWEHSPALADVRRISEQVGTARLAMSESDRAVGFCMGLAEQQTGDPLGVYASYLEQLGDTGTGEGTAIDPARVRLNIVS